MNRITTLVLGGASLVGAMFGRASTFADEKATTRWPGTKVGEPTPKVKGVPAELASNLAHFDDLDFRVYTGQHWQDLHNTHSKDVTPSCTMGRCRSTRSARRSSSAADR